MSAAGYTYPVPNSRLMSLYDLSEHIEGGYYAVTHVSHHVLPLSAVTTVDGQQPEISLPPKTSEVKGMERSLATTIFYLLTPSSPRGYFHMNKSTTMHCHHAGRARYTLIKPTDEGPIVSHVTIGEDADAGEVRQLLVEGGIWKSSGIPSEDLAKLDEGGLNASSEKSDRAERIGCLISEVVFPGFDWADHAFLTVPGLQQLFAQSKAPEAWESFKELVRPDKQQKD